MITYKEVKKAVKALKKAKKPGPYYCKVMLPDGTYELMTVEEWVQRFKEQIKQEKAAHS